MQEKVEGEQKNPVREKIVSDYIKSKEEYKKIKDSANKKADPILQRDVEPVSLFIYLIFFLLNRLRNKK